MADTLYVVDTFSLLFQVYHAIGQPMTGSRGQPTNAVYGFTGDLRHLLNEVRPTHLICALDSPGPGTRSEIYADYKANRKEIPPDLAPQIPLVIEVMKGYCLPVIEHAGWEADDVLATLTRAAVERGMQVRLVTNDKDARQLLGPNVQLYNIRKRKFLGEAELLQEWGVRPDQVIDFQTLVGDSVDNIPGVPLIGPKTAGTLLKQFGTLDEILAHTDDVSGKKVQENLKTFGDRARMSRRLVTLNTHLPLEIDWENARVCEPDYPRLLELFTDFGFRRYSDEVRQKLAETAQVRGGQRKWRTVADAGQFASFVEQLKRQKRFCFDLETTSVDAVRADIVGWAFCWEPDSAYYLPVDGPPGEARLDPKSVLATLRPILEDPGVELINQNIKYDLLVLKRAGVNARGVGLDPMIGDYLLDAGARSHGLDQLARKYLNREPIPISDLIGKGKQQKQMFEVEIDKAAEYASEDADLAWQLAEIITAKLKQEGLWELYWDLERPLVPVLVDMEFQGIRVDVDELLRQSEELTGRLNTLIGEIHALAGHEFNIDSPKQLAAVLFDELKLPVLKRTKTGFSTDQDVLEQLALLHPLPAKITEHRQFSKLKGTYLDALPAMVNPETGRIHASFNQVVAATGRLSSSDPNLQNIPVRTEEGRQIRRAFVPSEPGWKLVCADYSQIELRMLAHFSQDPELLDAFRRGEDIHTAVASEIFGVADDAVTSEMRRVAKAVNFGVIYGQSPYGLSQAIGISVDDAGRFIDGYFARYAAVDRYLETLLDESAQTHYARTILGRRREIVGVRSRPGRPRQRNLPERTAINTVIQGSAADLIKRAMIDIHARIETPRHPARMLLQIHDELVFEAPAGEVESLIEIVREEMQTALDLSVPLVVDVKVGDNWLDAK